MTVLVLGYDGYTGWPLTCRLLAHGHDVIGVDNYWRRVNAPKSVTPINPLYERVLIANELFPGTLTTYEFNVASDYGNLRCLIQRNKPDTIFNLAQIPSAPYSMRSRHHAWHTHQNNVKGSHNLYWALHELDQHPHVIQLATMGEYGTPDTKIPEGFLEDGRPAPKDPMSAYHSSKVATTVNTLFLSRLWDIPTTEIYQGIVYGVTTEHTTEVDMDLVTRFDVDERFGTVLNRFTAQAALDRPLSVYGEGGQCRAMLPLRDSMQCLDLVRENPPTDTSYQAVNQFQGTHRILELAEMVSEYTGAEIMHVENPRVEDSSRHHYEVERNVLDNLGYEPTTSIEQEFLNTFDVVSEYVDRVPVDALDPTINWVNR